nr:hypothetical protein [Tanacetum cinerariifolium]
MVRDEGGCTCVTLRIGLGKERVEKRTLAKAEIQRIAAVKRLKEETQNVDARKQSRKQRRKLRVPRIGDRRIRRLSAYKQWKAASKTDMDRNKKSCYKSSLSAFPSFFSEIPEIAAVSFLKRTVTEFVTAIFSGELRVGVMLQRKRIRADNKTLLQTGICDDNVLDALGFTLESHDLQVEDLPMVPLTATPKPLLSIAQEALQMCEEAVEKVRNCVKYVKTSEPSEDYFLGLKQQLQVGIV